MNSKNINLDALSWRKAKASSANGSCVEVACPHESVIAVRDSKLPTEGNFPHLLVDSDTWCGLLAGIKEGSIA